MINGNPAISYYTFNNNYSSPAGVLKYKRSDDADGNGWTKPVVIVKSGGVVGLYNSLHMVDGKPAISYYDQTNQDLKFIQASDVDGASWPPTAITIDAIGDVGKATSLQIVNHVPAIAYYDATNFTLKYVSANDASGAGWGTPQTLTSGGSGEHTSMITNANDIMIAYKNLELPYFISGSLSGPYFRTRQSGNWNDVTSWETSPVADFSSGVITPSTNTPDFTSNTITVQSGHTITVTANVATDQTIVNSGGAIVVNNGSILSINDGVGFDITVNGSGTVQAGGNMVIRSTSAGTASVGSSTGTITGSVTVERYIPDNGHRALRLLTAATNGTQTIKDAWQEGGAAVNNLGTQITSPLFNGTNGFDANSPLASIYKFNQTASAGTAWTSQPVTNTNVKRLESEPGYLLQVFGDRNASPSNSLHNATTLRSTGSLRQGTQPAVVVSSTGGYTLTGNPYASPIDFETIAGTPNLAQYFYIFDANLSGRLNIGGFRLVERLSSNTYQYTPVLGSPVVDNTMRYINSGQAFLLGTTGSNANVVFTEGSKTALLPDLNLFRPQNQNGTEQQLLASLLVIAPDTTALADGIRVRFNNSYSATVTAEDVIKMSNITTENLASRRNNNLLIVEKRPEVTVNDTIYLDIANMGIKNYSFQFSSENMPANLVAALQDNFTGSQTDIPLNSITNLNFSVTSDPASSAPDRFKIVLRPAGPLPITFSFIKAYQQTNDIEVEWRVLNEAGIKNYEVQKSADGRIFSIVEKQTAVGNNMSIINYRWVDVNATAGDHFYRIRSIGLNDEIKYSPIVKVTIGKGKAGYFVYPNPPTGDLINLQFVHQPKGTYNVRLINTLGQVLLTKKISHMEGSSTETIQLTNIMQKGQYILEVTAPNKSRKSFKLSY
ncbi:MAG: T9SS type A sorting domain-containing protein [Chitinophagaceae bacterium]|nr:T9SS type A sorting domain-containing protein [Chitinophagaceae bacterium]